MADDNKLWFEMGVRDRVTENLTEIMKKAALVQKEMDAITASESAAYQNAAKLEQVYDKIAIAMQRIDDARSKTSDPAKLLKLSQMEEALNKMKAAFKQVENSEAKMGLRGSVALEQLKQGFQLMTTQVARYASEIENTAKKEAKASDDEIRRQDKLKSKLYELQNLRKKLSDNILSSGSDIDTTAASKIAGQLWSKEMQVRAYMKNGKDLPLDFFGADYTEMKRQAEEYARTIGQKVKQANLDAAAAANANAKANQNLVSTYDKVIEKSKGSHRILEQVAAQWASVVSLYSAEHLLKSVIQVGGEFEQQHIALQNILGDIEQADTLFNQIQTLAVVSPFNFRQLTSYTKQTAAYGIPYEELYDTTKRLADLSAGLGVDMGRLILAYGQVRSAAVLRGQELRQFTEAGIPLVQKLADKFTALNGRVVTTGEVFELISKRKVPFEMVKDILWDMTDAGGSFYQMQFKLSDTLLGKWSNLQDAWEIMLSKFAEGGSTGGDFLKTLVQWTTNLIESLDKLSPVIKGAMGGYAITRLTKMATGDIFNTEKTIISAKKLEAARLQREALTRQLSEREREILQTSTKITANDVQALASAGRLNTLKLQQLYLSKQINQSDVARLVNEKAITVEQGTQIVNATRLKILWGSLKSTVGGFLSGIWSTITSPAMMITAGLSAALSIYASWKEANEEQASVAKATGDSIVDQYNKILKVQQEVSQAKPVSDGDYLKGITDITDILKSVGSFTPEIDMQSRSIEDLGKRYSYLKDRLNEVSEAYKNLSQHAETSLKYAIEQTDGWFDESIVTNMKDLSSTMEDYDKAAIGVQRFSSIIQEQINTLANMQGNEDLKKAIDGKSLEEELKVIAESPYWQNLQNMVGQVSTKAKSSLENFNEAYFEVLADWKTITDTDLPEFIQGIEDSFKREHPDIDLENLDEAMKIELKRFVHQALTEVDGVRQDIKDRLEQDIDAHFKINVGFELSIPAPPDYWRVQYPVLNQLFGKLSEKGINRDNSFYQELTKNAGSSESVWKYMDKRVDELKTAWQAEEKLYGAASEQATKAKTAYDNMKEARDSVFGTSMKETKKTPKQGKDTELEGWKERAKELDNFYNVYKRYAEYMSKEDAMAKARESGVFKGKNMPSNISDYLQVLHDFRDEIAKSPMNTDQRRSFWSDLLGKIDTKEFEQEFKEAYEKMMKTLREEMTRQSNQWSLYKQILDQTGNKEFAMGAFFEGQVWDSQATALADTLRIRMEESLKEGGAIPLEIDWSADEETAKRYFRTNFQNGDALFEIWKEIVKLISTNYTNALKDGAKAYQNTMTAADKVLKIQQEIADLESNNNSATGPAAEAVKAQIEAKRRELEQAKRDAFRESGDYLNFYNAILTLTIPEAEKIGLAIKKNLNEELKSGKLSARQYLTEIKKINDQMKQLYNKKSGLGAFLSGGLQGYFENMKQLGDSQQQRGLNDMKTAEINFQKAVEAYNKASSIGDSNGMEAADAQMQASESAMQGASAMQASGEAMSGAAGQAATTVAIIDKIVHGIDGVVQGLKGTFDEIREMYEALGYDTESDGWQDANTFFSSFSKASASATKGWDSLKNGDVGGVIEGVVGSFTGWITGFAKGHDAKREHWIQLAQEQINAINRMRVSLERSLERNLSGIYNLRGSKDVYDSFSGDIEEWEKIQALKQFGLAWLKSTNIADDTIKAMKAAQQSRSYYDQTYALLMKQRDELKAQYYAEEDKKDSDSEKLADYKASIEELQDQIAHFAEDMAKALYDIDFKSWADELSETLVNAWAAGESGAEAYKKKVSEILSNLGVKMISERFIANALEPIMNEFMKQYETDDGVLTEAGMRILGQMYQRGEELERLTEDFMNGLNEIALSNGADLKDKDSSSSSLGGGIKAVTEQTADLLASYINAIRADVSVNRITLTQILVAVQGQAEMPVIARAQLEQLRMIVLNTNRNADAAEMIYDLLHKLTPDGLKLNVKY